MHSWGGSARNISTLKSQSWIAPLVDGQTCALLAQFIEGMPLQVGFGEHLNPALQEANTKMRIALIDRVLAYLSGSSAPIP
jgi:hypothetical protein